MSAACDLLDLAAEEYAKGAASLEEFGKRLRGRYKGEIPEDAVSAAFGKAAERYRKSGGAEIEAIRMELYKEVAATRRTGAVERILGLRKAGLLTGPRTIARNTVGNTAAILGDAAADVPAALMDMALARFTGNRTVALGDIRATKEGLTSAVTKGLRDSWQVIRDGATPADIAKYDFPRELSGGRGLTKWGDWYANHVFRLQSAADKPFREYAFKKSLVTQAGFVARKEGLSGAQATARVKALTLEPTDAMRLQAIADSEEAVFSNGARRFADGSTLFDVKGKSSNIADLAAGIRQSGSVGAITMDAVVPFVRTPTNIAGRTAEFSPAGGLKLLLLLRKGIKDPVVQREFSKTFGRSVTGTGVMVLGYQMYKSGTITPMYAESNAQSDTDRATGRSPGTILINGQRYRLGDSPLSNMLVIGATIADDEKKGKGSVVMSGVKAAGRVIRDMPLMAGIKTLNESIKSPETQGGKFLTQFAGSFVPTILADVAAATDGGISEGPKRKSDGPTEAIMERIPGLRQRLPIERDSLGGTVKRANLLNPLSTPPTKEESDPVVRELVRTGAKVTKAERTKDPLKPTVTESQAAYEARAGGVGADVRKAITDLMGGSKRYLATSKGEVNWAFVKAMRKIGGDPSKPYKDQPLSVQRWLIEQVAKATKARKAREASRSGA